MQIQLAPHWHKVWFGGDVGVLVGSLVASNVAGDLFGVLDLERRVPVHLGHFVQEIVDLTGGVNVGNNILATQRDLPA